jgi:hypothetical protein
VNVSSQPKKYCTRRATVIFGIKTRFKKFQLRIAKMQKHLLQIACDFLAGIKFAKQVRGIAIAKTRFEL